MAFLGVCRGEGWAGTASPGGALGRARRWTGGGHPAWKQAAGRREGPAGPEDAPGLAGRGVVRNSEVGSDPGAGRLVQPPAGRCARPGRGAPGPVNRSAGGSEALLELTGAVAGRAGPGAWREAARCLEAVVGSDGRARVAWELREGRCWGSCPGGMWGALLTEGRAGRGGADTRARGTLATPHALAVSRMLCAACLGL